MIEHCQFLISNPISNFPVSKSAHSQRDHPLVRSARLAHSSAATMPITSKVTYLSSLLAVLALSPATAAAQGSALDALEWMAGCWERVTATRVVEEQWMAPRGTVMLGISRTTQGDRTVEYEQMRLRATNGKVVFTAQPSRQPAADFEATRVSDSLLVLTNEKHDFPQRIIYRRNGPGKLDARIEGTMNGQARDVDFNYSRVKCPE